MTTATTTNASNALTQAATGGAYIVDWTLTGSQVTPDSLRATLAKHGYDASIVPDINQTEAVRRAAKAWTQKRDGFSSVVLKAEETDDEMVISIRKDVPGNRRNDGLQFLTLTWDKINDQWMAPQMGGLTTQEIGAVNALIAKCDSERTHLDCDFIRPVLIQSTLKGMGSVSFIRRNGGSQVVASIHRPELDRLCDLVCDIGDCYMGSVGLDLTDARTVRSAHRSVQTGIMAEVSEAREQLAEWRERGTRLPSAGIGGRIVLFKELRAKLEMYAGCLAMRADDLHAELADAEADARDLLDIAMGRKGAPAEALADASPDVAAAM